MGILLKPASLLLIGVAFFLFFLMIDRLSKSK